MPPPVKMPIRAVRAALVWFRKTTALDGKAGIGAGAAIDPVAPIPDIAPRPIMLPLPTQDRIGFLLEAAPPQRRHCSLQQNIDTSNLNPSE